MRLQEQLLIGALDTCIRKVPTTEVGVCAYMQSDTHFASLASPSASPSIHTINNAW